MHRPRHSLRFAACTGLAAWAASVTARADTPTRSAQPSDSSVDYGYVFSDDVMRAGAFTPSDPRIVVVGRATRVTLIRPRTAFVMELRKSVENL
jgi:hypothetical protein